MAAKPFFPPAQQAAGSRMEQRGDKHSRVVESGPGDLLWEHKSKLHWAFGDEWGWTPRRVGALWEAKTLITCGRQTCSVDPDDTQHRGGHLEDLPAAGSMPQGQELEGDLSREEAGQFFPSSPLAK